MLKRSIFCIALCISLILNLSVLAYASTEAVKQSSSPRMSYIASAYSDLYINASGQAQVDCQADGYQGVTTKMTISANLQQYRSGAWVTLKTFTASNNSDSASLYQTTYVSKGYSYRVVTTVTGYSGSLSEKRTMTSDEYYY